MPRTISYEVYKFEELNEQQRKEAIELYSKKNHENLFDYHDGEMLQENFNEKLVEFGYPKEINTFFSLSYCQGDGVTFDMDGYLSKEEIYNLARKLVDDKESMEKFEKFYEKIDLYGTIKHTNHHYCHAYTFQVNLEHDIYDEVYEDEEEFISEFIDNLNGIITENLRSFSFAFEKEGYKVIEEHYSDEYIRELLIEEEIEFELGFAGNVVAIW
jgi:hypothetical protein